MGYSIEDFALDLRKSAAPPNHIWVGSGRGTCAPLADTVMGVRGFYGPPVTAPDATLMVSLRLNGHMAEDMGNRGKDDCGLLFAGAEWRPDRIERRGTYHYRTEAGLLSVGVTSRLAPLRDLPGFVVEVRVENRANGNLTVEAIPKLDPGAMDIVPLGVWEFTPPRPAAGAAEPAGADFWENTCLRMTLIREQEGDGTLGPHGAAAFRFGAVITEAGADARLPGGLRAAMEETFAHWRRTLDTVNANVPEIYSSLPGLEAYCRRSLASGLVSLWDHPDFVVTPFPATSGIDGGSICCYPWDVAGYSAQTMVMLMGGDAPALLRAMLRSGIDRHISMSLDGGGLGWCSYAYSMWSIMNLFWTLVTLLDTGWEMYGEIRDLFLQEEARLPEWEHLKDYGRQQNLLEMRTCGYEYFVPSPNAERAWCYDRLADIAEKLGETAVPADWRNKAEQIRASIRENLWDSEKAWFVCLHPAGHREFVYSIQCYDALRMDACTPDMKAGLLAQLKDGAFLGGYGVSSVSAEDTLHYELNDPDWSGGGSYTGEGPNLAETLWRHGEAELAWDVLSRHFWMGEMLPYFPQEHYCDRPAAPANKRASIVAGVAGMQAVLCGMAGFTPELDGGLRISPHVPKAGYVEIRNYRHRKSSITLYMEPERIRIWRDGTLFYEGAPREVLIPAAE